MEDKITKQSLLLSAVTFLQFAGIISQRASNFKLTYEEAVSVFYDDIKEDNGFLHILWSEYFPNDNIACFTGSLNEYKTISFNIASGLEGEILNSTSKNINTKVSHLLSQVTLKKENSMVKNMPLEQFSYTSIFPDDNNLMNNIECQEYYENTYKDIVNATKNIIRRASKDNNLLSMTSAFDSLFFKYMSNIPAYLSDNGTAEISLYEYAKIVAAFTSLFFYQEKHNILDKENNFAIIRGDFFSIQNFIFNKDASNKNPAKSLRGKSFYVSLLSDIASLYILEELGLSYFNIMMNAAGQFVIISYNSQDIINKINYIKNNIEQWLYNRFYCSVSMGLSLIPCSKNNFMKGNFDKIVLNMIYEKEKAKLTRFNLSSKKAFVFSDYHLKFNSNTHICEYCNMEPAVKKTKSSETDKNICNKCDDYIELGEKLTNASHINIFHSDNGIFGRYKYDYDTNNIDNAVHRMHIDLHQKDKIGYNSCDVIHYKSHVVRNSDDTIRSFEQIANYGEGADILAVYKADVDNLGLVFSCGLSKKDKEYNVIESKITFSKINMLSRLVHNFFSYYLSYLMDNEKLNVYTVFAGGDDLFIVGKYNDIIKLAGLIHTEFTRFTGENKELSISAGIELFKDGSIWYVAEKVEERLSRAKNYRVKNDNDIYKGNIDILYSTNKYDDFIFQYNEFNKIISIVNEDISKNFYYKLLEFCEMEENYQNNVNTIENLMWRPRLYNSIVALKLSNEQNEKILTYFTKYIVKYPLLIKTMIALKLYDLRNKNN